MNTMHHSMTGSHARWAVLWIGKKGWVVKDFENDIYSAMELYMKVGNAGKKGATLLCRNVGFPPARKYAGKMEAYNRAGITWCPYCRQLRKFKKTNGFYVDDIYYPQVNMQCPVCGITTENYHVKRHNPAYGGHTSNAVESNRRGVARVGGSNGSRSPSKLTDAQRAAKRERAARRRAAKR